MSVAIYGVTLVASLVCSAAAGYGQETFQGRTLDEWSTVLTASQGRERQQASRGIAELAGRQSDQLQVAEGYSQLVQLLSDDDAIVRYWGVRGITWFVEKLPPGDGGRQAATSTLMPLLEDRMPEPRIAAAETLVRLGVSPRSLAVLTTALEDPRDRIRVRAALALQAAGQGAAPAKPALEKAANDRVPGVQKTVRRILQRLERTKP